MLGSLPEELQLAEMVEFVVYVSGKPMAVMRIEIGRSGSYADPPKHC